LTNERPSEGAYWFNLYPGKTFTENIFAVSMINRSLAACDFVGAGISIQN
jgi:hypothetical protein